MIKWGHLNTNLIETLSILHIETAPRELKAYIKSLEGKSAKEIVRNNIEILTYIFNTPITLVELVLSGKWTKKRAEQIHKHLQLETTYSRMPQSFYLSAAELLQQREYAAMRQAILLLCRGGYTQASLNLLKIIEESPNKYQNLKIDPILEAMPHLLNEKLHVELFAVLTEQSILSALTNIPPEKMSDKLQTSSSLLQDLLIAPTR